MGKNALLLIGKIVGVHGLKGNIKVYSYAESISVYVPNTCILVKSADDTEKRYKINWVKHHGRLVLLSLTGIENRNDAESLTGSSLFIKKEILPESVDDSYYWFDIIGLSVFTEDNKYIGNVESIFPTSANDVYTVKCPGKDNELLLPALESVILEIDLKNKRMTVALPEGL